MSRLDIRLNEVTVRTNPSHPAFEDFKPYTPRFSEGCLLYFEKNSSVARPIDFTGEGEASLSVGQQTYTYNGQFYLQRRVHLNEAKYLLELAGPFENHPDPLEETYPLAAVFVYSP